MPNEIYHRSEWGNPKAEGFGDVYFDAAATNKLYNHSDYYENSDGTDKILRDIPNKASIVLTPTAYSDGSLNTVIPTDGNGDFDFSRGSSATRVNEKGLIEDVQVLSGELVQNGNFEQIGSELVTNGNFDTDSDWTLGTGWSISDGKLVGDGAESNALQSGVVQNGKTYKITLTANNITTGYISARIGSGGLENFQVNSNGTQTFYATADNGTFVLFRNQSGFDGSIDNVSVKEVGQNWSFGTGWSMGDGKAIGDGTMVSNVLEQDYDFVDGSLYRFTFTIKDYVSGSVFIRQPFDGSADAVSGNGTYTFDYVVGSANSLKFRGNSFIGSIDDVSFKLITDDTDIPRIDYTSGTGALLLEPQRTNLIPYSNLDFGTGSVPDGWIVGFGTGTFSHNPTTYKGQPAVIHRQETTGRSYLRVLFTGTNAEHTIRVEFDKSRCLNMQDNDVIVSTINVTNFTNKTWADVDANGILEFQTTFGADADGELRIGFGAVGNADGDKTLVWGMPQMELGSYGTSLIPTSGSTVTRSADVATNSGNADLFNDSEGVLYAEIAALADDGTSRTISINNTVSNRVFLQLRATSGQVLSGVVKGGVVQGTVMPYSISQTSNIKLAIKYKQNDFALWVNGIEVGTSSGNVFASDTLNNLSFDSGSGAEDFYGKVKSVAVFKEALTDAELQQLTS